MALVGIDAVACEVEVDVASRGFGKPAIVGLPDIAVKESLERVNSALHNSGYAWPQYRVLINLAPADVKKEGPAFDLPIALGVIFGDDINMGAPTALRSFDDRAWFNSVGSTFGGPSFNCRAKASWPAQVTQRA
ncbi:MAG: hypothetical protein AMXMBFR13_29730 [Phycisphaerae bacterium]